MEMEMTVTQKKQCESDCTLKYTEIMYHGEINNTMN